NLQLAQARSIRRLRLRLTRVAGLDVREEGGVLPELFLLPVGERMVVALRAAETHAEEESGRRVGDVLRPEALGLVETERRGAVRSGGARCRRHDLTHHPVVAGVGSEA